MNACNNIDSYLNCRQYTFFDRCTSAEKSPLWSAKFAYAAGNVNFKLCRYKTIFLIKDIGQDVDIN